MIADDLQKLMFETLSAPGGPVAIATGGRIFDRAPPNADFPFVSFGPTDTVIEQVDCMDLYNESFQIDVWTDEQSGKKGCKELCIKVIKALKGLSEAVDDGDVVDMNATQYRILEDQDGVTTHGVVIVEALLDGDRG